MIQQAIRDICQIWKQEFRSLFRDEGVMIFFLLVPALYPLLYAFIYTNETIRDVPAVVVDDSRTALSREYLHKVDATPDVQIVAHCADMEEARRMLCERKAYGIIYIPADFSTALTRREQTQVSIYCDMSSLLYYKALLTANTNVSLEMNADIKIQRAGNTTDRQDEITVHPIEYEEVALYNPTNGFAAFLLPAVLMLIIQQTLLLGVGMSVGTARERNTLRASLPPSATGCGNGAAALRLVSGKTLCYLPVYAVVAVYVLCFVPWLFSLNRIALPGLLLLFTLPYLLACIFFALTLSLLVRNRETCMLLFVFTSVPLLFLSGISWPGSAIPAFWKGFSWLFPSTFGINGYVRINSMGATLHEVSTEYYALWIQAAVYGCTACFAFRRLLSDGKKRNT